MLSNDNGNSLVETPAAPEWLSKLENRQERKLASAKLGHETGAGAPCGECGEKCPGLDLHFWRKVCRNCKCRKDEHLLTNDDMSGWAQFEILGQIRSKPAYIRLKALSNKPVNVEWVPPNVEPDVMLDYMDKLGMSRIPVAGSKAAQKRKQQLEFQVPPHDLDASLCDNLNESETRQMEQYIQKLRKQCVGQGIVVRIGGGTGVGRVFSGLVQDYSLSNRSLQDIACSPKLMEVLHNLDEYPILDSVLNSLLLEKKLEMKSPTIDPNFLKLFVALSESSIQLYPIAQYPDNELLTNHIKGNVYETGTAYYEIKTALKQNNVNIAKYPKMVHVVEFCGEYLKNPQFKAEVDTFYRLHKEVLVKPICKAEYPGIPNSVAHECGLPQNKDYKQDLIFNKIINSAQLNEVLKKSSTGSPVHDFPPIVVISNVSPLSDIKEIKGLDEQLKSYLETMGLDELMLRSSVANLSFYDRLFATLNDRGINFSNCRLLAPLHQMHNWLLNDGELMKSLEKLFVQKENTDESIAQSQTSEVGDLIYSQSNNFCFESNPTTSDISKLLEGKLTLTSGDVSKSSSAPHSHAVQQTKDNDKQSGAATRTVPALNCNDCKLVIKFGDVAVKADRAGNEFAWHPECFKCCTCRELLADLVYFFHHNKVYCCRDLADKLKIPRCKACDELIFTKEYTAAEGYTFHIKHFCCYQCDLPLAGKQYIPDEKNNMPLCLKCYNEFMAVSCQHCHQLIGPTEQGIAWGEIHWHGKCFVCAGLQCGKSLIGGQFCVKHNKPFCSSSCIRSFVQ